MIATTALGAASAISIVTSLGSRISSATVGSRVTIAGTNDSVGVAVGGRSVASRFLHQYSRAGPTPCLRANAASGSPLRSASSRTRRASSGVQISSRSGSRLRIHRRSPAWAGPASHRFRMRSGGRSRSYGVQPERSSTYRTRSIDAIPSPRVRRHRCYISGSRVPATPAAGPGAKAWPPTPARPVRR